MDCPPTLPPTISDGKSEKNKWHADNYRLKTAPARRQAKEDSVRRVRAQLDEKAIDTGTPANINAAIAEILDRPIEGLCERRWEQDFQGESVIDVVRRRKHLVSIGTLSNGDVTSHKQCNTGSQGEDMAAFLKEGRHPATTREDGRLLKADDLIKTGFKIYNLKFFNSEASAQTGECAAQMLLQNEIPGEFLQWDSGDCDYYSRQFSKRKVSSDSVPEDPRSYTSLFICFVGCGDPHYNTAGRMESVRLGTDTSPGAMRVSVRPTGEAYVPTKQRIYNYKRATGGNEESTAMSSISAPVDASETASIAIESAWHTAHSLAHDDTRTSRETNQGSAKRQRVHAVVETTDTVPAAASPTDAAPSEATAAGTPDAGSVVTSAATETKSVSPFAVVVAPPADETYTSSDSNELSAKRQRVRYGVQDKDTAPAATSHTTAATTKTAVLTTHSTDQRPVTQNQVIATKKTTADEKALLLEAMVNDRVSESPVKIHKKSGVSMAVAIWLSVEAKRFVDAEKDLDLINVREIHYTKQALETIAWLPQHFSHFPELEYVDMFEANGRADINESVSHDKETVGKDRKYRAHSLWTQFNKAFGVNGRMSTNSLVCVLYDVTAVESLMKAVYDYGQENDDGHERLARVLVVRHKAVFILVMTAALSTRQLPLDWLMRQGIHTSTFLWVNIRERSWSQRFNTNLSLVTGAKKERKTDNHYSWNKVSDMTIVGMNFLSLVCSLCRRRVPEHPSIAVGGVEKPRVQHPTAAMYVHVKPHRSAEKEKRSSSSYAVDNEWYQTIMAFTKQFRSKCQAAAEIQQWWRRQRDRVPTSVDAHGGGESVDAHGGLSLIR